MDIRSQGGSRKLSLYPADHSILEVGPSRTLATRPLSDIREITEPNLYEPVRRKPPVVNNAPICRTERVGTIKRNPARPGSKQSQRSPAVRSPRNVGDGSSIYSIPVGSVPPRSSSHAREQKAAPVPRAPAILLCPPRTHYQCITNNGQGQSPVKEAFAIDPGYAKRGRLPSKTIIKLSSPIAEDILNHPTHLHPRVKLDILLVAPLFVGGSSVEGTVRIIVDEADRVRHRKTLTLERLSVDLLGMEEVSGNRKHVFLALANELIDLNHPPPPEMVEEHTTVGVKERSWILFPSVSTLPFLLRLPLEVGPPPFHSKHARIRYILCATLTFKDGERQLCVRCSQDTAVLSVYDPEKALVSLPSPLTVQETYYLSRGRDQEYIVITAGLHRQVWVSGTTIFADVHIVNNSHKTVKKVELQLERRVLCYRHAAASTLEMSASQARIFDQDERTIAAKAVIKAGAQGWNGVAPHATVLRTCDLELPRGHATIKCNKYFEVRYFLNVTVGTSHLKPVTVQLPIILIHMNSLDVPTNSVAQVAAAIEEKRAMRTSPHARRSSRSRKKSSGALQGRAFNAPRLQSTERARQQQEDIDGLGGILHANPRRGSYQRERGSLYKVSSSFSFKTPPSNRKGRIMTEHTAEELRRRLGHLPTRSLASSNKSGVGPSRANDGGFGAGIGRATSRASSALGFYLHHAQDGDGGGKLKTSRSYTTSSKAPSLVSSFEIRRRPLWAKKPGWLGTGAVKPVTK